MDYQAILRRYPTLSWEWSFESDSERGQGTCRIRITTARAFEQPPLVPWRMGTKTKHSRGITHVCTHDLWPVSLRGCRASPRLRIQGEGGNLMYWWWAEAARASSDPRVRLRDGWPRRTASKGVRNTRHAFVGVVGPNKAWEVESAARR